MSTSTAILFPGQGSQTDEMRDDVARARPDLLELAIEVVGEDPFPRAGEGTNFAQPAIFCASLAGWHALGCPRGDLMAGHSLGRAGRAGRRRARSTSATGSSWWRCAAG